jgi:hypothetical protein
MASGKFWGKPILKSAKCKAQSAKYRGAEMRRRRNSKNNILL